MIVKENTLFTEEQNSKENTLFTREKSSKENTLFTGERRLEVNTMNLLKHSINTELFAGERSSKVNSYCINCGKNGHVSKNCLCPIISIGIICVKIKIDNVDLNSIITYLKKIQNNYLFSSDEIIKLKSLKKNVDLITDINFKDYIEYLLIKRKNSLNYVEFIRGKYDVYNLDYLIKSFNLITIEEKKLIKNNNFNYLWNNLWGINSNIDNNEYKESKEKFDLLKKGFYLKKNEINIYISFDKIINNLTYKYTEPEWGFPKGRRNSKEKNIDCAKREFEEETNIKDNEINIINMTPLEETYIASNGLKYKHIYYISQIKNYTKNIIIKENLEIGDIKWFKFNDGINIIREYNIEKKNILLILHYNILYLIKTFKEQINYFFTQYDL
jgi:8-oxo-dGTP pyrophosphatase MutT (NUDIX family)